MHPSVICVIFPTFGGRSTAEIMWAGGANMARKVYSLQFEREAVAMTRQPGASVRSVAKSPGVRPQTLEYWVEHPPSASGRRGKPVEVESRTTRRR